MYKIRKFYFTLFLLALLVTSGSWGYLVHKTTNQLAVYMLPNDLRKFYYVNMDYVVTNAPRPDIRRNTDSTEATKHFIDLEMYGDSSALKLPLKWEDAVKQYTKDTLFKYGYVPYQVMLIKKKLTEAFRSQNADSILFYSTDIGHYIADSHVPLHASVNYDGQLSGQKGLHSLWESMIPELELNDYNISSHHTATYLDNPEEKIMDAIRHSASLLPDVFNKEKEISQSFTDSQKFRVQIRRGKEYKSYTSAFAKAYAASLHNTINDQLLSSAALTADFWYTSWVDGGKPRIEGLLKTSFRKQDKRALKKEIKSFRHNNLITDSLLRAKKGDIFIGD